MSLISDLILDSRLETSLRQGCTVHSYVEVDPNRRRITREECWKRKRPLGQGSYGQVWLEECIQGKNSGTLRAVKMVLRQSSSKTVDFSRELTAIAKFSHPKYDAYFVKSFGWYENEAAVNISMEYLPHGDLQRYLLRQSPLPVADAQNLTCQILEGLHEMHKNEFAHRDLKPANILIKSQPPDIWWIKIADFGISKRADDGNNMSTVRGTAQFMAPELLFNSGTYLDSYNYQAADIWALGEIAFRMLTGTPAFKDQAILVDYYRNKQGYPADRLMFVGETCAQFFSNLMAVKPQLRMNAANALCHPWIMELKSIENRGTLTANAEILGPDETQEEMWEDENTELMREASARWSTTSNAQIVQSNIHPKPGGSSTIPVRHVSRKKIDNRLSNLSGSVRKTLTAAQSPSSSEAEDMRTQRPYAQSSQRSSSATTQSSETGLSPQSQAAVKNSFSTFRDGARRRALPGGKAASSSAMQPALSETVQNIFRPQYYNRATVRAHSDQINSIAFSPDSKTLASASHDKTVRLWDTDSGAALGTLKGHSSHVYTVAFSPDGKTLATASRDKTIRIWDVSLREVLRVLRGYSSYVYFVAFSPDGRMLASGSRDKTVRLWDADSGAVLHTINDHRGLVNCVAFSPDGNTLASASHDETVRLGRPGSKVALGTLKGHSGPINDVAFSPDGKTLVSASEDRTIRLWHTSTRTALGVLRGHSHPVYSVAFSPDGETLASASRDRTVRLWNANSGVFRQALRGHPDTVSAVAFSPDGKTLASASDDKTFKLWTTGADRDLPIPLRPL